MFIRFFIFCCFVVFGTPHFANAEEGKIIYDFAEDEEVKLIDYPALYQEYMQELDLFDEKYPGYQIEEDFGDDIAQMHPDYSDYWVNMKQNLLRKGIKLRRFYQNIKREISKLLIEEDLPIRLDDSQYEMGEQEEYKPTDKPLVIMDFKKIIAYSSSEKDIKAMQDKLARDAGLLTPYERRQLMKKALLEKDWKAFFSYSLFDGKAVDDELGIGSWVGDSDFKARIASLKTNTGEEKNFTGILQLFIPDTKVMLRRNYQQFKGVKVNFANSQNVSNISLNWPMPHRHLARDGQVIWVDNGVVSIPLSADITNPKQDIKLDFQITADICADDDCKVKNINPVLELKSGKNPQKTNLQLSIALAQQTSPKESSTELFLQDLGVEKIDGREQLRLIAYSSSSLSQFDVYVEGEGAEEFFAPLIKIDGKKITTRLIPIRPNTQLIGHKFNLIVCSSAEICIKKEMIAKKVSVEEEVTPRLSFRLLFWAFLGGLLLNIMPCVFPVLAIKLRSLSAFGSNDIQKLRQDFTFNILGIFSGFAILLMIILGLKLLGYAIGWGMQFQSIGFLVIMIFVVSLFMAHLRGIIHINTPQFVSKFVAGTRNEKLSQFLGGMFLVLLATPCTAPYLGTALGIALTGTILQISIVVLFIAIGLALPYIIFAISPELSIFMPRPGKWLNYLDLIMQVMLFATVIWLLSILSAQTGGHIWWIFALFLLVMWGILGFRTLIFQELEVQEKDELIYNKIGKFFNVCTIILLGLLIGSCYWVAQNFAQSKIKETNYKQAQSINIPEIENILQRKGSVLLKVGANWCLTCYYNDITAFGSNRFNDLLKKKNITLIEVDWSNYQPEVLKFMQQFGRSGLPFYVLFSPQVPGGMVLPEVLSEYELIKLLD